MCIQAAHSSAQGYSGEFRLAPEPPFPPCDDVPIRAAATHPHLPLETSLHEVHAAQREMMTSRAVTSGLRRANGGQPRPDPLRASSAAEAPEHAEPRTAFVTPDPERIRSAGGQSPHSGRSVGDGGRLTRGQGASSLGSRASIRPGTRQFTVSFTTMSAVCAACWRRTRPASGCRRLSRVYRCVGGRPALPSSQFHHPARLPLGVGSVPVSPGWIGGAGLYASSMSLPLASVSPVRIERAYCASRGFVRRGHFSRESLSM